jgi:cytochrome P450
VLSLPIIGGDLARDDRKFFEYASNVLKERAASEEKALGAQRDIMHHLLHATDPATGNPFSQEQLGVESSLLIAAGADTTSLTLAAAFFYLVHNPRILHVLVEEIQSAFAAGSADSMTPSKLIGLPYLRAVIDETLRLAPPVPSLLPREVLQGGITIDGAFIPEGTIVGVPAYAIHRSPAYFPEPEKFWPERWLATESQSDASDDSLPSSAASSSDIPRTPQSVSLARQAFVAFSQGSRGCIGRQLAYYELHTALAQLLYRFDVRLASDAQTEALMKDSTEWKRGSGEAMELQQSEGVEVGLRQERQNREEFQLFDMFLANRNGPMIEFKERDNNN